MTITRTINVTRDKLALLGPTGNKPSLTVSASTGLNFTKGARIQGIRFNASGNNIDLIKLGGSASSGNEDDTDGSIDRCEFNLTSGCTAIEYNGRNCNVNNNIFSDSGDGNTALLMRWDGIQVDIKNPPEQPARTTWRKNRFFQNTVDLEKGSRAIVASGKDFPCYGLLITDNDFRRGCQILRSEKKGVNGLCIADNVWGNLKSDFKIGSERVIEFEAGEANGVIYNNKFYGVATPNANRPVGFVRVKNVVPRLAISRNLMDRSRDAKDAIQLNSSSKSGVVAYQNNIKNGSSSSRGNNGVTDGAIKFSN